MTHFRSASWRSYLYTGLIAAVLAVPTTGRADSQFTTLLQDFESGTAGAQPVNALNSHAAGDSNSVITQEVESVSGRLKITDPDGGTNGAAITLSGAVTAPGYYLFTADVKVDNASSPIDSYGMAASVDGAATAKVSDLNAGYVMNLSGVDDATLGYQTIGAAVNIPNGGTFPRNITLYFGTDVSGNDYSAPSTDGDFSGMHRSGAATWSAGSTNAVYVDNIKRHGPGNLGEERHLWISVGDGYTDLAKLETMLTGAKANNFTAVDILARYRADAYYVPNRVDASYANPEPFGNRVGTTSASPENDPLQYAIDRGHELGLKVNISFSSFLVSPNNTYPNVLPTGSIMGILPSGATVPRDMVSADNSNEGIWADPGREDVREYTKNVLMDIVSNYDIDGVMFDRARYPGTRFGYNQQALTDLGYSTPPSPFSSAFKNDRRDVITDFLGECYDAVTTKKPWIVVGSTPIAYGNSMADTYNNVFQYWPEWTARKTANRSVSFGCMDLWQPQFYRLYNSAAPFTAPEANNVLMKKALYGDTAVDSLDFGLMPGAYGMVAPLFYHPGTGNTGQSLANAQNITDARALPNSGFGVFAATTTLADIALIRDPAASTAGTDVLAGTPTPVDYLFKNGYDNIVPNAVTNFNATPQARGSVVLTWDAPAPAADGDSAAKYLVYKSTTQPVREIWANQITKLGTTGTYLNVPVGEAGSFYYRIVPVDDYNNHGAATEIGPITVTGSAANPDDIIIDNLNATVVGTWSAGSFSADKYGSNYIFHSPGTGANRVTFTATIPVSGNWTVSEWHPQGANRAADAKHVIQNDAGAVTVLADQRTNGGKWNELGTYTFTQGNNYSVTIDDVFSAGVVMADGIKFSYVPQPTVAPAQPTDLAATVAGTTQINLTWNDNANNETGYELERTIVGGTTNLILLPADTNSYNDTSLAPDTEYRYVVRAYNTGAQSPDSNKTCARTLPQLPDDIIIDDTAATFVGSWGTGTFSSQYGSGYHLVYKGDGSRTGTFAFTPERDAVYDIYEWHVGTASRAIDAPHIINHAGGSSTVIVNQTQNGGQWNKIGSYIFNAGTEYSVVLTNQFTQGTVMMADAIKVVYAEEPPTTPAAPSNMSAIALSHSEIALSWSDNAVNESGFEIVRTKTGGSPEVIAAPAADSISYIDTGLDALTEYSYFIRALNSQGASSDSNVATVTTLSSTPADQIIDNVDADLVGAWTVGSFSADKYATSYAFRSKSATGANKAVFSFPTPQEGLYEIFEWHPQGGNRPTDAPHVVSHRGGSDTVLVNQQVNGGQWNSVGTFAFDENGNYNVTINDKFLVGDVIMADAIKVVYVSELPSTPPPAPSDLTATPHGTNQIDLSWTDNTDNESGFEIVRNGVVLTTVAADVASYDDTAAEPCTPFTYTIRAIVYGTRSDDSNAATVSLDEVAPEITAPADVTVGTDSGSATASGVALGAPVVSDNCDASPTVTNNAQATFPVGTTVVTWTATDAHGNIETATQNVTVQDLEAPQITAPSSVTAVAQPDGCYASDVELGEVTASDNIAVATITNDAPTTYPVGTTTVTWTATDGAGNIATATQSVVVQDNPATGPVTVTATAQAWDRVEVDWSVVANASLYEIRYATQPAGPYTVAGSMAAEQTSFIIGGLLPNTTYYFAVEARNSCGGADGPMAQSTTPLYTGSASDPNASDTWQLVDDENSEGGSYFIRARRSSDDAAAWNMSVPVSGTYRISVYIPDVDHLSTQANYTVNNGSMVSTTVVNQRQNTGEWVDLGDYNLTAGAVTVGVFQSSNSANPVVVDALNIVQLN